MDVDEHCPPTTSHQPEVVDGATTEQDPPSPEDAPSLPLPDDGAAPPETLPPPPPRQHHDTHHGEYPATYPTLPVCHLHQRANRTKQLDLPQVHPGWQAQPGYATPGHHPGWGLPAAPAAPAMPPPTITKIAETEWEEVVWANGTRYFFNPYSRESRWDTPPEVEEARKPKRRVLTPFEAEILARVKAATGGQHLKPELLAVVDRSSKPAPAGAPSGVQPGVPPPRPPAVPPPHPPSGPPPGEELPPPEPVDKVAAVAAFKEMMEEAGTTPFSLFERQAKKCNGDPRFEAIPSLKERKAIFEELCRELAARKAADKKGAAPGKNKGVGVVKGDIRKLASQPASTTKPLDADAAYLQLLREVGVHGESRWTLTKSKIAQDPRFKALGSSAAERVFRRHVDDLYRAQKRTEESVAAKERESQRQLQATQEEARKRQQRAAHDAAVAACRTLLGELIKDPGAVWEDWEARLLRDPQGRATQEGLGGMQTVRQLFVDHCTSLQQGMVSTYRSLLDTLLRPIVARRLRDEAAAKSEVGTVEGTVEEDARDGKGEASMLMSFAAVESALGDDPRFVAVKADIRERVWREVVHEVQWEAANPGRVAKRRGPTGDAAVDTTDQAYLRAYIDVDSKRLKR